MLDERRRYVGEDEMELHNDDVVLFEDTIGAALSKVTALYETRQGDTLAGEYRGLYVIDARIDTVQMGSHTLSRSWLVEALGKPEVNRAEKRLEDHIQEKIDEH